MEGFTQQENQKLTELGARGEFIGALDLGESRQMVMFSKTPEPLSLPYRFSLTTYDKLRASRELLDMIDQWKKGKNAAKEPLRADVAANLKKLETYLLGWELAYAAEEERMGAYGRNEPYEASELRKRAQGKKGVKLRKDKTKRKGGRKRRRSRKRRGGQPSTNDEGNGGGDETPDWYCERCGAWVGHDVRCVFCGRSREEALPQRPRGRERVGSAAWRAAQGSAPPAPMGGAATPPAAAPMGGAAGGVAKRVDLGVWGREFIAFGEGVDAVRKYAAYRGSDGQRYDLEYVVPMGDVGVEIEQLVLEDAAAAEGWVRVSEAELEAEREAEREAEQEEARKKAEKNKKKKAKKKRQGRRKKERAAAARERTQMARENAASRAVEDAAAALRSADPFASGDEAARDFEEALAQEKEFMARHGRLVRGVEPAEMRRRRRLAGGRLSRKRRRKRRRKTRRRRKRRR